MTEYLEKELFSLVDKGSIIVLPTEESARAVLKCYVKSRKRGILASQIISFDRFASLFLREDKRAVDDFERLLFSEAFQEHEVEKLSYFYNPEYPEMKDNLSPFIRSMLPSLNEVFEKEIKDKNLYKDLVHIMDSYKAFLEKNDLIEMGWAQYKDRELDKDYYLLESDAFPKERKLLKVLSDNPKIHRINIERKECNLTIYKNEAIELRALFQKIRELIKEGVPLNDIAISTSALTRLRPYIEREAALFDLPLNFVPGIAVKSTPPGRFMLSLNELYQKNYRIDDMKRFFLDPAFRFKDSDEVYAFISKAVALSVKDGRDRKNDRYRALGFPIYSKFRSALDSLMKEKDPLKVRVRYESLVSLLFGEERFVNSDINDKVYSFTLDAFSRFLKEAESFESMLSKPLFPVFLDYVETLQYTPREKVKGINVYPFSEAALTPYRYHFLISLNENESHKLIREASFLSEYERESFSDVEITEALLASYQLVNDNISYSSSENTYSGYSLPLVALMDSAKRVERIDEDPYQRENEGKELSYIYPLEREGYERALKSSFKDNKIHEEIIGIKSDYPKLSFSVVDDYRKCPYRYALKYLYGLDKTPPFEIVTFDYLELGTRLHSILERFFKSGEKDSEKIKDYFDEEMNAWFDGMRYSADGNLIPMEFGSASATKELISYVEHKCFENLKSIVNKIIVESDVIKDGNEIRFSSDIDNSYRLSGIADMIASSKLNDSFIIYDFKSGSKFDKKELPVKSLQFSIYDILMKCDERFKDKNVEKGVFVTIKDANVVTGWEYDDERAKADKALLDEVAALIKSGNWNMSEDKNECQGCAYKGICRRKFVIR